MSDNSIPLPNQARVCIALCALGAAVTLSLAALEWDSPDLLKYGGFLMVAILTCGMQISVPGITRNLPLTFLFVLLGILELTTPETVALAAIVTVIQCYWNRPRRPRLVQVLLTVSVMTVASGLAERVYHSPWLDVLQLDQAVRLMAATFTLFLVNTLPVAFVIAMAEGEEIGATWRECYFGAAPYYLGGAMIAELAGLAINFVGWQTVLLTGPLVYLVYRSYRLYLVRLEAEKRHAEEVSSLHLRTIEALAMAIEAKDHTTHDHLQRVQVYAMELAKDLDLEEDDTEALRAAALLHDIGKLAIPEHIISKPGRLTPEEFEKMKIHPIVGGPK